MEVKERLELVLKNQSTEYNRKTLSLFKSCAHWLSENPETETNLHVLDLMVLGENARIYEHVGSLKFPKSSEWKSLFGDWILWLKDLPPQFREAQQKVKQLERALEDPKTLEETPYYFLLRGPGDQKIINLNFIDNKFVMRYFANVTPNLPPSLILYNTQNTISSFERHGGIMNLEKVNTSVLSELQDYPKFAINNQEPQDFGPITRQQVLELAEEQGINFEDISHCEKVKWDIIHDAFFPLEDTAIPAGLAAEIHEVGLRMESDPGYTSEIASSIRTCALHQNQISPQEVRTFFEKLHAKTGIKKLEEIIEFSSEICTFINNRFANGIGYREGGLKMQYVYMELPREHAMEYFGDLLVQAVRGSLFPKEKKITRAFFGWIRRHLMKEFFPETKFSYDEHLRLDEEEKREYDLEIEKCIEATNGGIDGELLPGKVRAWFEEFDFGGRHSIPGNMFRESCANPFQLFLNNLATHLESPQELVRCIVGFMHEEDFTDFEHFRKKALGPDEKEDREPYLEQALLGRYFETRKKELREGLEWLKKQASTFFTSYFRFIKDPAYRAGYYYAQKQISKRNVLGNLTGILQTPEKELMNSVIGGEMNIYDKRDMDPEWNSGLDRERQMRQSFIDYGL